jgi:sec-independent protein translocase protein TatB
MLPEVGGVEILAIAALALIIIGPKDLPVVLRKVGKFVGKMRGMAQEFRASFDELARQSELEELRKEVEAMRTAQSYDPTGLVPGAYGAQPEFDAAAAHEAYVAAPSDAPPPAEPVKPARRKSVAKTAKPAAKATPAAKARPAAKKAAPAKPKKAAKPKIARLKADGGTVQ